MWRLNPKNWPLIGRLFGRGGSAALEAAVAPEVAAERALAAAVRAENAAPIFINNVPRAGFGLGTVYRTGRNAALIAGAAGVGGTLYFMNRNTHPDLHQPMTLSVTQANGTRSPLQVTVLGDVGIDTTADNGQYAVRSLAFQRQEGSQTNYYELIALRQGATLSVPTAHPTVEQLRTAIEQGINAGNFALLQTDGHGQPLNPPSGMQLYGPVAPHVEPEGLWESIVQGLKKHAGLIGGAVGGVLGGVLFFGWGAIPGAGLGYFLGNAIAGTNNTPPAPVAPPVNPQSPGGTPNPTPQTGAGANVGQNPQPFTLTPQWTPPGIQNPVAQPAR